MALRCIGKMTIIALKAPFHKANERRWRLPESKNRSTVKARFRRPNVIQSKVFFVYKMSLASGGEEEDYECRNSIDICAMQIHVD